jgi:hypothetical protein
MGYMFVIPAIWKLRQEDQEFKTGLGFRTKTCLKKKRKEIKGTALNSHSYPQCKTALGR